jgi:hypothetical protein
VGSLNGQISISRVAAIAALVGVAVVLALIGRDVLAWRDQTDKAGIAVAASSSDFGVWQPSTVFPTAVSRWLLGAGDDVRFGMALQRFQLLRTGGGDTFFRQNRRAELAQAELQLDQQAATAKTARARSIARTLHGILLYGQLRQQTDPLTVFRRVTEEFRKAIEADPSNAAAKYDLNAILGVFTPLAIAATQGDLPEKGASTGSHTGAGGSAGNVTGGGGF